MMSTIRITLGVVVAASALAGCRSSVSNNLDGTESPDAGAREAGWDVLRREGPRADAPSGTVITGEHSNLEEPFIIGEQVRVTLSGDAANAAWVSLRFGPHDRSAVCPGSIRDGAFVCTIAPATFEGEADCVVVTSDDPPKWITVGTLSVRRLVVTVGENHDLAHLQEAEGLQSVGDVSLPGGLATQQGARLSPSGRYLLFAFHQAAQTRLGLLDLVTRAHAELPEECGSLEASSFEPEVFVTDIGPGQDPRTSLVPERTLWCVADGLATKGNLYRVSLPELPQRIDSTAFDAGAAQRRDVQSTSWFVDLKRQKWMVGLARPTAAAPVAPFAFNPGDPPATVLPFRFAPSAVIKGDALQATYSLAEDTDTGALDWAPDAAVLVLSQDNATAPSARYLSLFRIGSTALNKTEDRKLSDLSTGEGVFPDLVPQPDTNLVGFAFDSAPSSSYLYGEVGAKPSAGLPDFRLTLAQVGLEIQKGQKTYPVPVSPLVAEAPPYVERMLVRSGDTVSVYSIYPLSEAGGYLGPRTVPGLLAVAHHPRQNRFFALSATSLVSYDYQRYAAQSHATFDLTSLQGKLQVMFIQP